MFAVPQAAKWAIKQPWAASVRGHPGFRFLAGLGATCNIVMLMAANLLGFVTGLDGLPDFLRALVQDKSFLCAVAVAFFSAAQVIFFCNACVRIAMASYCVIRPMCNASSKFNGAPIILKIPIWHFGCT